MNIREIQAIAQARGIKAGKMRKADLIRTLQRAEGNLDCFETEKSLNCDQVYCLWREDCIKPV